MLGEDTSDCKRCDIECDERSSDKNVTQASSTLQPLQVRQFA